jgi:hypothetical protein
MNKSKIAIIIIKLLGITLLLAIALTITILIETLQLISALIQSLSNENAANVPQQQVLMPSIPIKLTNLKPKWMLDLLPREYLDVKHLKAFAKQLRIKSYSKLNKAKLVMALNSAI